MSEMTSRLEEAIRDQLQSSDVEKIEVFPLPSSSDRELRIRTLEEIFGDFEMDESPSQTYLIQIKGSKPQQPTSKDSKDAEYSKGSLDGIYLADGRLNGPYLEQNVDVLIQAKEFKLAKNILDSLLSQGINNADNLLRRGDCLNKEGRSEEAQKDFEESIAYQPTLSAYRKLIVSLIAQKKDQYATEVIERALRLKDVSESVRYDLHKTSGNCLVRLKDYRRAENHYLNALELRPSADEIHCNIGSIFLKTNRLNDAEKSFADAIAINSKNDKAYVGLGCCFLSEGEKKEAHDYFAKALEMNLQNPTAIYYLIKCAYEIKSYARAEKILGEYVQSATFNSNLLYSLAGLQFHLGKVSESKKTVDRILKLNPKHTGAGELGKIIQTFLEKQG